MKFYQIFWLILCLLLISACTPTTPTITPTTTSTAAFSPAGTEYPAPIEETPVDIGYPASELFPSSTPEVTDPNLGQVHGQLLLNGESVTKGIIYLAEVISDSQGNELVVGFDRESKLRGDLDQSGNFLIVNVPPGRYGIIYDLVTDAVLLHEPGKDVSLIVEITSGKILDLGSLNYPNLPTRE